MSQLVSVNPANCNLSLTCIRTCPVKAIKITGKHAVVVASRCIGCGHCITVCAQDAIVYRDEIDRVNDALASGQKVVAMCDPSFSAEFIDVTDYRKVVAMVHSLGFSHVVDTSFGVDLVAYRYKEMLANFQGKYYIHTICPAVASYVEKFQPELVDNLAPFVPPQVAMAKVIRRLYGNEVNVVYITACVSAKDDNRLYKNDGRIEATITFTELREMFNRAQVNEFNVEFRDFDPPAGRKGGLFPVRRGMLQAVDINQELLSGDIIIANGKGDFMQSLEEFKREAGICQHLEIFYCEGCIMGPGMSPGGKKFLRRSEVIKYVNKRLKGIDLVSWHEMVESFRDLDLSREYIIDDCRLPQPSEAEINRVLHELGKNMIEDQLDCGSCGYATCREFAIAFCQGLTNYEMCYSYTINRLHLFISKVNAANEKLKRAKEELKLSEEKARAGEAGALEASEITTAMLDKISSGVIIVDENLKVIESNRAFVKMVGEDAETINELIPGLKGAELASLIPFYRLFATVLQSGKEVINRDTPLRDSMYNVSVFTIKKHKVVGAIIRDLSLPEVQREEVVNRARAVIRENLETVQQIAFLLGESASKTEKILTSIINTQIRGNKEQET